MKDLIEKLVYLKIEDLEIIQDGLKSITEKNLKKLRNNMKKQGFISPFHVWKNTKGTYSILDGAHRLIAIQKMIEDLEPVPSEFPCVLINAKDEKEAKKKLLSLSSQYSQYNQIGVLDFFDNNELTLEDVEIFSSDFDIDKLIKDQDVTIGPLTQGGPNLDSFEDPETSEDQENEESSYENTKGSVDKNESLESESNVFKQEYRLLVYLENESELNKLYEELKPKVKYVKILN